MPVFQYNSKVTSESHDILANYVASSVSWHKCYGTLRPRGNTKKPKSPDDMFAKLAFLMLKMMVAVIQIVNF
jgi:hypothetical protein